MCLFIPRFFGKPLLYIYISSVFYFYFIYKSQIELKEEDILVVSSQIGSALFFSPVFFRLLLCSCFYFNGSNRKWRKKKEKQNRRVCVCVSVGRKEMTPLIIYDQTFFWGFSSRVMFTTGILINNNVSLICWDFFFPPSILLPKWRDWGVYRQRWLSPIRRQSSGKLAKSFFTTPRDVQNSLVWREKTKNH